MVLHHGTSIVAGRGELEGWWQAGLQVPDWVLRQDRAGGQDGEAQLERDGRVSFWEGEALGWDGDIVLGKDDLRKPKQLS